MERYDPLVALDSEQWQSLDEAERIDLVQKYHRRAHVRLPNPVIHAAIHTAVENQVSLGDEVPAHRTLGRLMREGLDRHEAIHAMGSVLTEHMYNLLQAKSATPEPNAIYFAAPERLTAKGWRSS